MTLTVLVKDHPGPGHALCSAQSLGQALRQRMEMCMSMLSSPSFAKMEKLRPLEVG